MQNALQDTPLRILTSCHKRAINAQYQSGFNVGEVVWGPFGEAPLTTNQMNRMFCFLPALHTIWLTPEPVKCATGVFQGEAYVAYLKNAFIAEYGMLSWMDGGHGARHSPEGACEGRGTCTSLTNPS